MSEKFSLKDQIYGDVQFTQTEWRITHTKIFQRLNYIRVLGPGFLIFPSANNSIFEHAIGTLKLTSDISNKIEKCDSQMLRLCALLHPIGEIPFGQSMTEVSDKWGQDKEIRTIKIVERSTELNKILGKELRNSLVRNMKEALNHSSVSYKILYQANPPTGTNVLDFVLRDQTFVGWTSGIVDTKRLIEEMKWTDGTPQIEQVEDLINVIGMALRTYYDKIYYYEPKRIADLLLQRMVDTALSLKLVDPSFFPFSIDSNSDVENFVQFTDERVLYILRSISTKRADFKEAYDLLLTGKLLISCDLSKYFFNVFPELKEQDPEHYLDEANFRKMFENKLREIEARICKDYEISPLTFYLDSPVIYRMRIYAFSRTKTRQKLFSQTINERNRVQKIKAFLPQEFVSKIRWKKYFTQ